MKLFTNYLVLEKNIEINDVKAAADNYIVIQRIAVRSKLTPDLAFFLWPWGSRNHFKNYFRMLKEPIFCWLLICVS